MKKFIIFLIIFFTFISPAAANTYQIFVDKEFGFFGVRSNNYTELISYDNKTFYIDIGDTVGWENYVASDERVTVISDNKLWKDDSVILGWNYKVFKYTFNKSGTYKFHLKENRIFQAPENFTEPLNTSNWFKYQVPIPTRYQKIVVGQGISTGTNTTQKLKNKIIASNPAKKFNKIETDAEEEEYEEIVPQVTAKIEKAASPYEKYTILELLKSIFTRT